MAYIDQGLPPERKKAAIGVIAIHALMGTVLITGLSTVVIPEPAPPRLEGRNVTVPLPPPPPPVDEPTPDRAESPPRSTVYTPPVRSPVNTNEPNYASTDEIPVDTGTVGKVPLPTGDGIGELPMEDPVILPDPIPAKPRNNPSSWVSTSDYRSSWINREMTGLAKFRVSVGTNGRVTDCRILQSTGHQALDNATCKLVSDRARFTPAKDGFGDTVSGSYTASLRWELPD